MRRLPIIVFVCLLIIFQTSFTSAVRGQSYIRDQYQDKVTLTLSDQKVTAQVDGDHKVKPKADKLYHWYSAGQIRVTQGGYSGKLLHGGYSAFFLNKNLKEKGQFKKGLKTGTWSSWYENGNLSEQNTWKSGAKTGTFSEYDENGSLKRAGEYKNGLLEGQVLSYTGKDSVQESYYKGGKLQAAKQKAKSGRVAKLMNKIGNGTQSGIKKVFKAKKKTPKVKKEKSDPKFQKSPDKKD